MLRALFAGLLLAVLLSGQKKPVTIDAVANANNSRPAIVWAPDGERFAFTERGAISIFDARNGKERTLISLDTLEKAAVPVSAPPAYDWTNRNVRENAVQWFADGKRLLVSAGGDLFTVDIGKGRFEPLTQTAEVERDPKLSPDNRYVSFLRGSDIYSIEVASKVSVRLTANGSDTLLNGRMDWVYPEELDLTTAYWWAPDSRHIAYLQFDVAREPLFPQVSLLGTRALAEPERYPKAGDPNPEVRLGVIAAEGGETRWIDLGDTRNALVARVAWSPNGHEIAAERLNRLQNKLDLLMADFSTGTGARVVLHEEDPYWINVGDAPLFLDSGRFLWTSERSGYRHLYLYRTDGSLEKQLTSGEWEVESVAGIEKARQRVLFTSTEAGPTGRQLYAVGLDGSGRERLSKDDGTHSVSLAPNGAYYLDDHSSLKTPPRRTLYKTEGGQTRQFRGADTAADEFEILPAEIVRVKAGDGTPLYAKMVRPAGFDATKKYPAVVIVYGGPHAQYAVDEWRGVTLEQALAQKGFVVWQLDNRGSGGRGHAFETALHHELGPHELSDQQDGIRDLISRGFVDARRIGLYGWSYGGFMTLYTITHAPGLIRAAIAGAPVTDWRNYDSIYTERYMGLPEENEDGYRRSATVLNAAAMDDGTRLLLVHNIEDDNVHFQNSLRMAEALEKAGKRFQMMVYPQKTHHVSGPEYRQLLDTEAAFFEENLK